MGGFVLVLCDYGLRYDIVTYVIVVSYCVLAVFVYRGGYLLGRDRT